MIYTHRIWSLAAALLTIGAFTGRSNAALVFTFNEVGSSVVMVASGSLNTQGLVPTAASDWGGAGFEETTNGFHIIGGAPLGGGTINTFFAFNAGTDFSAWREGDPWAGSFFGFTRTGTKLFTTNTRVLGVVVPGFGVRFSDLVGSVWTPNQSWTAVGKTFSSLGLHPGRYTVVDALSGESITYQIGPVPEPSAAFFILGGLGFFLTRRPNR